MFSTRLTMGETRALRAFAEPHSGKTAVWLAQFCTCEMIAGIGCPANAAMYAYS